MSKGEAKILEIESDFSAEGPDDNHYYSFKRIVVTTDRFVYGSKVIPMEEIRVAHVAVKTDPWPNIILGGIGFALLYWGIIFWKAIGLLALYWAYRIPVVDRKMLLSLGNDRFIRLVVTSKKSGKEAPTIFANLEKAVNGVVSARNQAHRDALDDDIASLPSA